MRFSQFTLIAALAVACASPAPAQEKLPPGYTFTPELTYKNVSQDPDGIWEPSDLELFGDPPHHPDIYTARVSTPAGEWMLSQITSGCSLQSECPFQLTLKRPNGPRKIVAGGMLLRRASAVLAADYSKIFTQTYTGIETFPVEISK
ncbi:hypothetical protein [Microvirga tunisiensis]|uniref:Uncharacterized protein n=1 Tax=Microvirga tunisiensis TaxID=2108360 RepID=A0A5N7MIR0_9HYPH|nr:hypothetical protein [Microvirga tunisiensis]MPR08650.1 hypothetical protein [Microvirga tunisiensis]MPR26925.1 hypothetical protein [Microvirga tunisiensis]